MLEIDPSGWKGSVSYGLGADISLPPCLATGIWNLVPKATSGPKSRGASLGTKLWRHVQRYCAQFLAFMVIYGNSVLWVFCLRNRKYPRISELGEWFHILKLYYEHDWPQIVRQEVLLAINCVNNKMRETLKLKVSYKGTYASLVRKISNKSHWSSEFRPFLFEISTCQPIHLTSFHWFWFAGGRLDIVKLYRLVAWSA